MFSATAARMSAFNAFSSILSSSWKSMARLVLPSRLELKRPEGSASDAPLAKVNFTTLLYVSPVQMIPACDHTGTPRHFHSSTTSGSACLMSVRTRASVSPRQSPSSLILASISREGESPAVASFEPLFFMLVAFFMVVVARHSSIESSPSSGPAPAGPLAGLLHPTGELRFVERVTFPHVEGTLRFGRKMNRRNRRKFGAVEEHQLEVGLERGDREEPALAGHAVPDPVPLDRLVDVAGLARHDRIDATSAVHLPVRQKVDPGLHGAVALGLGNRIMRRQSLRRGIRG